MTDEPEQEFRAGEPGMVAAEWDQEQARILDIVRKANQFVLTASDAAVSPTEVGVRVAYAFRSLPEDETEAMLGTVAVFELVVLALTDEIRELRRRAGLDN